MADPIPGMVEDFQQPSVYSVKEYECYSVSNKKGGILYE